LKANDTDIAIGKYQLVKLHF